MRKTGRKITSFVLALAMMLSTVLASVPAMVVHADTKEMAHLTAGTGNGNGHFGAGTDNPAEAFILSDKDDITDETISMTFRLASDAGVSRVRFVTKYVDDNNWSYIGYDMGNSWIFEYKVNGTSSYGSIAGLPNPATEEFANITMEYTETGLVVSVVNADTEESGTATVTDATFLSLKDDEGKIGVGAGYRNYTAEQLTDVYFSDVTVGETAVADYNAWTLYNADAEGQAWNPSETVVYGDLSVGTATGRKWIKITAGANNSGGHAYGNANAAGPITILDDDKTMAEAGTLSLSVKPSENWGIFYSYVDDNNWLYVGYDSHSKWYYQYKLNGAESYPQISGLPAPVAGEEMSMSITLNRETLEVTVNGTTARVTNQTLIDFAAQNAGKGRFGAMTKGNAGTIEIADVKYNGTNCMDDNWVFAAERDGQIKDIYETKASSVTGTVTDAAGNPISGATVRVGTFSATTNAQGKYTIVGLEVKDGYTISVSMIGYESYSAPLNVAEDANANVVDVQLASKAELDLTKYDVISSDEMKVYVGKEFPVVARYEMANGDFFRATEAEINEVAINGVNIVPTVTVKETTDTSKTYTLNVVDASASIDLVMDVKLSVEGNDFTWQVTNITKNEGCAMIETISVPNLSFATADARDAGANFAGAQVSTTTTNKADTYITFDKDGGFAAQDKAGYLYAFVGHDKLNAGLHSNSEAEDDKRVVRNNTADTIELQSAPWYYEMGDKNGAAQQKNDPTNRYPDYPVSELPIAKVAVAADMNDDKVVDWNDGAIAFRDVMHYAQGHEIIKDTVNYRIVMNFQSAASNPFLANADNIKKVYLATDGLPQGVMLKGYGNEGHDSANSEYADVAERLGGIEDFQKLIKIAHKYRTEIGIHVNAQEVYPEAKSFSDTMIQANKATGWGWLDQSYAIDKLWDLSTQARWKRFVQLFDRINDTDYYTRDWDKGEYVEDSKGEVTASKEEIKEVAMSLEDNMDFIYLDVWYQNAWETRRIAEEINSLGWRFSTEFSAQGEYDSTWQHWSTEGSYGGATAKGFNSDIIRFLRNDQRDSQVLNYPKYGGTADNPLLGGYILEGFEGWGADQNFDEYMLVTWTNNLPTRFLQHYYVIDWENYAPGESPVGNTEKQITLTNEAKDVVVVTRNEEQRADDYIERTITLNGKVVLDDVQYLLPWTIEGEEEKLYHYNLDGGTTTWELQDDWADLDAVVVYQLTDNGRTNETTVPVVDGTVTLEAIAQTAYVVCKAEGEVKLEANFGEGDYVVDPGFNGYVDGSKLNATDWTGSINEDSITVVRQSQYNIGDNVLEMAAINKDVEVSTTISGLTKDATYVAEVYVENNTDGKVTISVDAGNETVSEYALRSYAVNYVRADIKKYTRMQRMQVYFTAESDTATFTMGREGGAGVVKFDDIRVVPITLANHTEEGFEQDFEEVVNGIYPFVTGGLQGVNDQNIHLSQLHAPYTQAEWHTNTMDDVIDGEWSLKWNAVAAGGPSGLLYQTLPQNVHFEAGHVYTVEFDYQSNLDNRYGFVVGEGGSYNYPASDAYLALANETNGGTKHASFTVVGAGSGQTWVGIYSAGGAGNFVLDNFKVTPQKDVVLAVAADNELFVGEQTTIFGQGLDQITKWEVSGDTDALVFDEENLTVTAMAGGAITITYTKPDATTETIEITSISSVSEDIDRSEYEGISASANTEETTGEGEVNGFASAVVDGSTSTFWHSQWSGTVFNVSANNPAILTVDLGEELDIAGFKFTNRQGNNGLIGLIDWELKDAEGNVVASGTNVSTDASSGATSYVYADETVNAQYIVVKVKEGSNGFATMAEIAPIRVNKIVATGATIDDTTVVVGESVEMKVNTKANEQVIITNWTSSDESVATVDKYGNVTGIKAGKATITITNYAGLNETAVVTVTADTPVDPKPVMDFYDVQDKSAWFYGSVEKAFQKGLMGATGKAPVDGKPWFEPDTNISRAMVATVLYRMAGKPKVEFKATFSDVTNGSLWYSTAITWAAQNGVVSGYKDGRFGPDDNITRQDLAIMLRNYAKSAGLNTNVSVDFAAFKDGKQVVDYAASAVAWCVEAKLMSGSVKADGTYLMPTANATRAECAKMFSLLDDAIKANAK